jgi:hypothetical protein
LKRIESADLKAFRDTHCGGGTASLYDGGERYAGGYCKSAQRVLAKFSSRDLEGGSFVILANWTRSST